VLYLTPPTSSAVVRDALDRGLLGCMTTPAQGNVLEEEWWYGCDNGKYGKGYPGADAWFAWLDRTVARCGSERCLWALAPDVPFDAAGTLVESAPWLPRIRRLGIPAAYAAQDGSEDPDLRPGWDEFDVLFIAGSDGWKLGRQAADLAAEAIHHGLKVHMGRVNSRHRMAHAMAIGASFCDGTTIIKGPDDNGADMVRWSAELHRGQPPHLQAELVGNRLTAPLRSTPRMRTATSAEPVGPDPCGTLDLLAAVPAGGTQ
jgi:hypothetical protein